MIFLLSKVYGHFANVLFTNFWSRFTYELGQFLNYFRLISGWKNEVYIMVERTKHIHAHRSFRFLGEWHKTLANRMWAKGLIGDKTSHVITLSKDFKFRLSKRLNLGLFYQK